MKLKDKKYRQDKLKLTDTNRRKYIDTQIETDRHIDRLKQKKNRNQKKGRERAQIKKEEERESK